MVGRNFIAMKDNFKRENTIPQDSPHIAFVEEDYEAQDISAALLALVMKWFASHFILYFLFL